MKKMRFSLKSFGISHLFSIGLFTAASLVMTPNKVSANEGRCTFRDRSSNRNITMPLATSLDFCAFNIRSGSQGIPLAFGIWNGYPVGANRAGQVYIFNGTDWKYAGIIGERPLTDKCVEGNMRACRKWGKNMDRLIEQYERCIRERINGICYSQ